MRVAIHQPEHFPYLGFFQKMECADLFVLLDDVKFTKGNFQHRNKFLNKNGVEEWFTIGLEPKPHSKLINQITVDQNSKWKKLILNKLKTNFKKDFKEIYDHGKLVDINIASIQYCRNMLGINTPMILSSTLKVNSTKSQRLADICTECNASEYISGIGGKGYLDESFFSCKVTYFSPTVPNFYTTLQHL